MLPPMKRLRLCSIVLTLASLGAALDAGPPPQPFDEKTADLHAALLHCGPGDQLAACLAALGQRRVEAKQEGQRVVLPLGGAFQVLTLEARGSGRIVAASFRAVGMAATSRAEVASFIDAHAGAFPFSEPCRRGAPYCGVFYPKQAGGGAAIEIGLGLIGVTGTPAWRKPARIMLEGKPVYRRRERLLDIARTPSVEVVVRFSIPLGRDDQPLPMPTLLRPAFDAFVQAPFVRP